MNFKSNQVLIGIILLLIGVFAFFQNFIGAVPGNIPLIIIGGAFLLLYRTKRKGWSLITGVFFLYLGLARMFASLFPFINAASMFFIIPAIIFLILYFDKNKQGLLFPGMALFWFGVYLILNEFPFARALPVSLFPFCMGIAFVLTYITGKGFVKRGMLYIGGILLIWGFSARLNIQPAMAVIQRLPVFVSAAVIVTGIVLIVKAVYKKRDR